MSTPQVKRRRLNEANKNLHKPFKSPFRRPPSSTTNSDPPSSDAPGPTDLDLSGSSRTRPILPASISVLPREYQQKRSSRPSLAREIMQLRNEIQMLTQAQTLATSTKDGDLLELIDGWRNASRAAAEELFASTRDRVNRMGGVGAWREREKEQRDWRKKADMEELEAERERLQQAKEDGEIENERYDEADEAHLEDGQAEEEQSLNVTDDTSFTIDMMLKTLNIDLTLIGYNKEAQRWDG